MTALTQQTRALIKSLLPPLLLTTIERIRYSRPHYFGLNGLDEKLEKYLNYRDGFFVELGANDGVSQSNTLYYERYRNWRGVLIEPAPHNYLACRANRSGRSHVFCNACTSFDYKDKFVEIAYSNLMSAPIGLESDIPDPRAHARNPLPRTQRGEQARVQPELSIVYGALARPLNDILVEAGAPSLIDLLSLDVEGAEIEILRGIDHSRFRFKYMCIECRNREKLETYLKTIGYRLLEQLSVQDYLFCLDS
jgi:FkbM family methyltransferase